jgi:hypothetical protein
LAGRSIEPKFDVVDKSADQCSALGLNTIFSLLDDPRERKHRHYLNEPCPLNIDLAATDERPDEERIVRELTADAVRTARTPFKLPA